jgi:hypothetical protein
MLGLQRPPCFVLGYPLSSEGLSPSKRCQVSSQPHHTKPYPKGDVNPSKCDVLTPKGQTFGLQGLVEVIQGASQASKRCHHHLISILWAAFPKEAQARLVPLNCPPSKGLQRQ